ncbi:endo-beta-N-acetylglucosaminidase H [Cutibacterium acnes JCM 18918]|nr:endo-beta-N-acetylglucosaminidase H [Cutibacterium acnes JCM 18918]
METLRAAETQIRPLQRRGTKVLLSLLGNHEAPDSPTFQPGMTLTGSRLR